MAAADHGSLCCSMLILAGAAVAASPGPPLHCFESAVQMQQYSAAAYVKIVTSSAAEAGECILKEAGLGRGSMLTTCAVASKRSSCGAAADLKLPESLKMESDAGLSGFLEAGNCTVFFCSSLRRSALYSPV